MNTKFLMFLLNLTLTQSIYIDLSTFQNQMSQAINSIRSMHGVASLQLHSALTNTAQLYATKLAVLDSGIVRDNSELLNCGILLQSIAANTDNTQILCGESLAQTAAYANITDYCNPIYIAQLWNSQRKNYVYSDPNSPSDLNSDFTQLIWKSSIYMGVGVSLNKKETGCYVVVRYWPSGNRVGKYLENVLISSQASKLNIDFLRLLILVIVLEKYVLCLLR